MNEITNIFLKPVVPSSWMVPFEPVPSIVFWLIVKMDGKYLSSAPCFFLIHLLPYIWVAGRWWPTWVHNMYYTYMNTNMKLSTYVHKQIYIQCTVHIFGQSRMISPDHHHPKCAPNYGWWIIIVYHSLPIYFLYIYIHVILIPREVPICFLRFQSVSQPKSVEMPKETGVLKTEHVEPSTPLWQKLTFLTQLERNYKPTLSYLLRFTASFLNRKRQGDVRRGYFFLGNGNSMTLKIQGVSSRSAKKYWLLQQSGHWPLSSRELEYLPEDLAWHMNVLKFHLCHWNEYGVLVKIPDLCAYGPTFSL